MAPHLRQRKMTKARSACSSQVDHSPRIPICNTDLGKPSGKLFPRNPPMWSCWLVQGSTRLCGDTYPRPARAICRLVTSTDKKWRCGSHAGTNFRELLRKKHRGYLGRESRNIVFHRPQRQRNSQRARLFPAERARCILTKSRSESGPTLGFFYY